MSPFLSFPHCHQGSNGNLCGGFSDQPWRSDVPRGIYMPSTRYELDKTECNTTTLMTIAMIKLMLVMMAMVIVMVVVKK